MSIENYEKALYDVCYRIVTLEWKIEEMETGYTHNEEDPDCPGVNLATAYHKSLAKSKANRYLEKYTC